MADGGMVLPEPAASRPSWWGMAWLRVIRNGEDAVGSPDNIYGESHMVKEEGCRIPRQGPKDCDWAETRFISFSIPEEQLFGNVYVLARPNVGAVISGVRIQKGFSRFPFEMDFTIRRRVCRVLPHSDSSR